MDFCNNCNNYLQIKEIKFEDKRTLYYYCKNCPFKKQCEINKISSTNYSKKKITLDKSYLNNYKKDSNILPKKISKCPGCKTKNENVYEVRYFNNSYNIYNICSKCNNGWY